MFSYFDFTTVIPIKGVASEIVVAKKEESNVGRRRAMLVSESQNKENGKDHDMYNSNSPTQGRLSSKYASVIDKSNAQNVPSI